MKFIAVTVVASLLSVVSAQTNLANLPQCAQSCVGNGLSATGCNLLDIKCICSSSKFIAQISCCIKTACSEADQASTIKFASQLCTGAGITVPTNAASACAQVSGTSSTEAPASTSAASSAATTEASVAASSPSAGSSLTAGSNVTVTTATLSAGKTSLATATSTKASTSATANAGSQFMASGMGLVGAAFAALALL